VNYIYADHREFWPARKKALLQILERYPDSRWADDAALILACGKIGFEDDPAGAIKDLQMLIRRYPYGQTIVTHWDPEDGDRIDDVWLYSQGSLVFFNKDGSTRTTKPFKRHGIDQNQKEVLAYFRHVKQFPRSTKATAKLIMADVLQMQREPEEAAKVLDDIVSTSRTYLDMVNQGDRKAAKRLDGYLIYKLISRPEYRAHLALMHLYDKKGAKKESLKVANQLVATASKDGWLWQINRSVGDFLMQTGHPEPAQKQYQLSLKGLDHFQKVVMRRRETVPGAELSNEFFDAVRKEIMNNLDPKQRQSK